MACKLSDQTGTACESNILHVKVWSTSSCNQSKKQWHMALEIKTQHFNQYSVFYVWYIWHCSELELFHFCNHTGYIYICVLNWFIVGKKLFGFLIAVQMPKPLVLDCLKCKLNTWLGFDYQAWNSTFGCDSLFFFSHNKEIKMLLPIFSTTVQCMYAMVCL